MRNNFEGVAEISITKWEEENLPYKLPDDYKAFLQISDGLQLTWKIKKNDFHRNDQIFNLGSMHLNKLRDIKQINGEKFKLASIAEEEDTSDDEKNAESAKVAAFDIDSKVKDGRLALLYLDGNNSKP